MAMTLTEFASLLDLKTLPRFLQIQSGIYPQGCVYETLGRECSLSTGDLLKVEHVSISRFTAQKTNAPAVLLPLDFPGLFQLKADGHVYSSAGEMAASLRVGCHPTFLSGRELRLARAVVGESERFRVTSLARDGLTCQLLRPDPRPDFLLPLTLPGPFTECQDERLFTLRDVAEWRMPRGRVRTVTRVKGQPREDVCGEMTLTPVYEVKALTQVSERVLRISSDLDVEVVDVTDQLDLDSLRFFRSLSDLFTEPAEFFPVVVEWSSRSSLTLPADQSLLRSQQLIVHRALHSTRVLASEICSDSPRHFLVPLTYNGRFKRRPRTFSTAHDLERARSQTEDLHVVATRAQSAGRLSVHPGDQFLLTRRTHGPVTPTCACQKVMGGEVSESLRLPACLEGAFVELVTDRRQYSLVEICRWFPLPFNVQPSVRDLSLKVDLLAGAPGLHLREEMSEPCLLVSSVDLSEVRELPVRRTDLLLDVRRRWDGPSPACADGSWVESISEACYHSLRRLTPPPRPPKPAPPQRPPRRASLSGGQAVSHDALFVSRPQTSVHLAQTSKNIQTAETMATCSASVGLEKALGKHQGLEKDEDGDEDPHDYEYIDVDELDCEKMMMPREEHAPADRTVKL